MKLEKTNAADKYYFKIKDRDEKSFFEEMYIKIYEKRNNYIFLDYLNLSELPCEDNIDFYLDTEKITLIFNDERVDYDLKLENDKVTYILKDKLDERVLENTLPLSINSYSSIVDFLSRLYSMLVPIRGEFACTDITSELVDDHTEHSSELSRTSYSDEKNEEVARDEIIRRMQNSSLELENEGKRGKSYNKDYIIRVLDGYINKYKYNVIILPFLIVIMLVGISSFFHKGFGVFFIFEILFILLLIYLSYTIFYNYFFRLKRLKGLKNDDSTKLISGKITSIKPCSLSTKGGYSNIIDLLVTINNERLYIMLPKQVSLTKIQKESFIARVMNHNWSLRVYENSLVVDLDYNNVGATIMEMALHS